MTFVKREDGNAEEDGAGEDEGAVAFEEEGAVVVDEVRVGQLMRDTEFVTVELTNHSGNDVPDQLAFEMR